MVDAAGGDGLDRAAKARLAHLAAARRAAAARRLALTLVPPDL